MLTRLSSQRLGGPYLSGQRLSGQGLSRQGLSGQGLSGQSRRGALLPLLALALLGLIGLLALAIDIGMVAVARSQCQNAADAAAMAGARTINGNDADNYN